MKNRKYMIGLALVLLMAVPLLTAQSPTVTVTGNVPAHFSITNATDNGLLSATAALGALTPDNTQNFVTATATMRLRSNAAYKLSVQAGALNFTLPGTADNGSTISLSDLVFGVSNVDATGGNVANAAGHNIVPGYSLSSLPTAVAGVPNLAGFKTLNDVTGSATQILSGPRISKNGNDSSTNNFVIVDMEVAVLPQYFTTNTDFSTILTFTLASNP